MKKKIAILTLGLLLGITGVVSAASLWGTYKGYDIIRLTVNGSPIKATDAPAISFNNRTMIPIYMLKDAGISYTWDSKKQTVNINKRSESGGFVSEDEYSELNRVMQENRAFIIFADQIDLGIISQFLLMNYQTDSELSESMDTVNRISTESLYYWVNLLDLMNSPESKTFERIAGYVSEAKNYLLVEDTTNAHTQLLLAKKDMNDLHTRLDNSYNNTFGVKNKEK